jgi:hypothetical protein
VRAGRVLLVVFGSLAALIGVVVALIGAIGLWAYGEQDADGYLATGYHRLESSGYALASEDVDLGAEGDLAGDLGDIARLRVLVEGGRIFAGIGPERAVRAYLRGVPHHEVEEVEYDPFRPVYEAQAGTRAPARPGAQDFWAARAEGQGIQALEWDLREGSWVLVVMNADGSPGVSAFVSLGLRITHLLVVALAFLIVGLALLGGGVTMIVFGARRRGPPEEAAVVAPGERRPTRHPLRIEGALDPGTSRALWLVKWLLAIPHFVVLLVLFVAFAVVAVIAWFAILFTGRYPRALFDFNLGVLRWAWRVTFYSYGALGTDRYPPFSLGPEPDYPATLDLDYPETLSRGLVLVKAWLLAFPHYLVLVLIAGWFSGVWFWAGDAGAGFSLAWGGGLIGLLVLFAGVVLLFKKRYPRGIFDLVMGLQRWSFRVVVYATLMRDEYPPFRLDMGGREPPPFEADAPEEGREQV